MASPDSRVDILLVVIIAVLLLRNIKPSSSEDICRLWLAISSILLNPLLAV